MRKISLSLLGAVALAGCEVAALDPTTTRLYSIDEGTAIKALGAGKILTAQSNGVVAMSQDFQAGTTAPANVSFAIKMNPNGQLSLIVDGVEHAFTIADRDVYAGDGKTYGYYFQDSGAKIWVGLWNYNGTLDQALDPVSKDYMQIWGFFADMTQSGFGTQGFAVVGTETRPQDLAGLSGSATFTGRAGLNVEPATGFAGGGNSRTKYRGDLAMNVNFSTASISGLISNMTVAQPGQASTNTPGTIGLDPTTITGNGFSGTMTPDATLLATLAGGATGAGTYGGTFFGPSADQLGGTMRSGLTAPPTPRPSRRTRAFWG